MVCLCAAEMRFVPLCEVNYSNCTSTAQTNAIGRSGADSSTHYYSPVSSRTVYTIYVAAIKAGCCTAHLSIHLAVDGRWLTVVVFLTPLARLLQRYMS